jgi:hypothetical protein
MNLTSSRPPASTTDRDDRSDKDLIGLVTTIELVFGIKLNLLQKVTLFGAAK